MISIQFSTNPKKRKAERFFLYFVGGLILAVVFCLILGFLVKFLWNETFAVMLGLPAISYWQAIGLFILAKFFFGFGTGGSTKYRYARKNRKNQKHGEDPDSDGVSELAEDETFRKYWQHEGKSEYEAFLASRDEDLKEDPEDS